jgi:hypothetical protein
MRKKQPQNADENDSGDEVRRYARWALNEAGVGHRLPTPVDGIVSCARLAVSEEISLSEVHEGFFSKTYRILAPALSKLRALVDLREDLIYLDLTMPPPRLNFATLHDCGHKVLPWQRSAYHYEDDDRSLSPDIEVQFEKEANQFAAEVLFQVDRFTKEAADSSLSLKTPMDLSKRYGASCHAAIRRYVEHHHRPCAVLVCRVGTINGNGSRTLEIEHLIYSPPFCDQFGELRLSRVLDRKHPFSRLVLERRIRFFEDGTINLTDGNDNSFRAKFYIFNSTYRVFILVHPYKPPRSGWRTVIPV